MSKAADPRSHALMLLLGICRISLLRGHGCWVEHGGGQHMPAAVPPMSATACAASGAVPRLSHQTRAPSLRTRQDESQLCFPDPRTLNLVKRTVPSLLHAHARRPCASLSGCLAGNTHMQPTAVNALASASQLTASLHCSTNMTGGVDTNFKGTLKGLFSAHHTWWAGLLLGLLDGLSTRARTRSRGKGRTCRCADTGTT